MFRSGEHIVSMSGKMKIDLESKSKQMHQVMTFQSAPSKAKGSLKTFCLLSNDITQQKKRTLTHHSRWLRYGIFKKLLHRYGPIRGQRWQRCCIDPWLSRQARRRSVRRQKSAILSRETRRELTRRELARHHPRFLRNSH